MWYVTDPYGTRWGPFPFELDAIMWVKAQPDFLTDEYKIEEEKT